MTAHAIQRSRLDRYAPPIYLLLLAVAELLITFTPPITGMIMHALLLVSLLTHAAYSADPPSRALLLTLCLAPLIRLLSMGLPLVNLPQMSWYFLVSVPLFISCGMLIRLLRYSRADLGLRWGNLGLQGLIVLLGLALGALEYAILRPQPLIAALSWQQLVIPALILLVCTGFCEELIFRGVMQRAAYAALGRWAIIYVAAIFAVLHIGYRSFADLLLVFVVGVVFGLIVQRTGSLLGVTLAHGLTNIMLFLVMPFFGMPALPSPTLPRFALSGWALELLLLGLWFALLAAVGLLSRLHRRQRQQHSVSLAQRVGLSQVGALLLTPTPDFERLARAVGQWLAPDYVLIVGREREESVVSLAIGASGRRLRGIEGLSAPWTAFAQLTSGASLNPIHEARQHPFSRHEGNYLIVPLTGARWMLVRAGQGREGAARRALAGLQLGLS